MSRPARPNKNKPVRATENGGGPPADGTPPRAWFAKVEVVARAESTDGFPPRRGFAATGETKVSLAGAAISERTPRRVVLARSCAESEFRTHLDADAVDFTPEAAWERERARAKDALVAAERAMECARRRLTLLEGPMPTPVLVDKED